MKDSVRCSQGKTQMKWLGFNIKKPKSEIVVCPTCKRRMRGSVEDCGDKNCWHLFLPEHKKKGWWKKDKIQRKEKPICKRAKG